MIKKVCPICGKEFFTTEKRIAEGRGKYCSRECQHKSLLRQKEVVCCICGKTFELPLARADKAKTHYCSECIKSKKIEDKICPVCGKIFHPKKKESIFCSQICRYKAAKKGNTINIKDKYAELVIISKKWGEHIALISKEDIEKVSNFTWQLKYTFRKNESFYVVSSQSNNLKEIKLHRFILDCPDNMVVDHINGNTLDNRRENLRITTYKINANNLITKRKSKSGYRGIILTKSNKYLVTHSRVNLGRYNTLEEALQVKEKYLESIINDNVI